MVSIIIPGRSIPRRPTFELPRLNRDSPQAEGLVGWWPISEGGGDTLHDLSGYSNHASLDTAAVGQWLPQQDGFALDFPGGANSNAHIGQPAIIGSFSALTIAVWFEFDNTFVNENIFGHNSSYFRIGQNASAQFIFQANQLTSVSTVGDTAIVSNRKEFRAVTYNGATVQMYYNGLPDGSEAGTGTIGTFTQDVKIGSFFDETLAVNGRIWHLALWNRALTAAEIERLYAPATRWDLYEQRPRRIYVDLGAAATQKVYLNLRRIPERPKFELPRLNRDSELARGLIVYCDLQNGNIQTSDMTRNVVPVFNQGEYDQRIRAIGAGHHTGGRAAAPDIGLSAADASKLQSMIGTDATFMAWVQNDEDPPVDASDSVFARIGNLGNDMHYPFTDGNIYLNIFTNNGSRPITHNPVVDLTTIHQFVVTQKPGAGNYRLYLNGNLAATAAGFSSADVSTDAFRIGRSDVDSRSYNGTIFIWAIWNRALTVSEVYALYAPRTRWDLYAQRPRRLFFDLGAAPEAPFVGQPFFKRLRGSVWPTGFQRIGRGW